MREAHAGLGSDTDIFLHKQAQEVGIDLDTITDPTAIAAIREHAENCIDASRLGQTRQKEIRTAALQQALKDLAP